MTADFRGKPKVHESSKGDEVQCNRPEMIQSGEIQTCRGILNSVNVVRYEVRLFKYFSFLLSHIQLYKQVI